MHFLVFDDEGGARFRVFRWIAGREDILCGCSQDVQGRLVVLGLHGRKESAAGIVRGGKGALSGLLGERWRERTSQRKRQKSGPTESNKSLAFIFNKNRNSLQHGVSSPFLNSRQVTQAGTSINQRHLVTPSGVHRPPGRLRHRTLRHPYPRPPRSTTLRRKPLCHFRPHPNHPMP